MARAMLMLQGMSSSTEDEAPGKRRLQSPEEGAGPSQWTVKRPRTGSATAAEIGALVDGSSQQQRSDRHTQAISPAPSAGGSAGTAASPKPRRSQTSARPFTCQVEDCSRDVCELSTYHFRYRICNVHIRLPAFMRQGKLQRFCQQCGRCHELSEFEGNQRSCRAQLDRHNARRRQAKKNAQAAKNGGAGQGGPATAGSQPLSSASTGAGALRDGVRAYSADLEQSQRSKAIRPVGKLGQAMPAAEAAALLAAAANGQPRFALGGACSAFGQYHEAGPSQQPGSRLQGMGGQSASAGRQPALFKGGSRQQDSEESMSQQAQISSSSDGGNQTAEASAALQSLFEIARGSQRDGATSKPLGGASYRRAEKGQPEPSAGRDHSGTTLSAREREQAAAVAAELSARAPSEGVTKTASLAQGLYAPEGHQEGSMPMSDSAMHPKLRQKAAGSSRAAAMTSTWQHPDQNSLPALATVAATAGKAPEKAKEQAQIGDEDAVPVHRVNSHTQSDPIEPQPTPFEAFTQAPLAAPEKLEAVPPIVKTAGTNIGSSMESSAMRLSLLSASAQQSTHDGGCSLGARSMQASHSMSDSFAHGRSLDGSSVPTDGSRSAAGRGAHLLGFLQKSHLLETSQALAAVPQMGSAALSAALGPRAASTQSSMDLVTAENIAAALPDLAQQLQHGPSSLTPGSSSAPSLGKPPAFPQTSRPGRLPSVSEEEEGLPPEDAIRHWLQTGRPPGSKVGAEHQEGDAKGSLVNPAQKAGEAGAPERQQNTLAGSLPEGLRTALGLSMGQPVGQLKSAMEKGLLDPALPAAAPATVAVAAATVPGVSAGMLGAPAKVDAMLGSRAQLASKPQQLESIAPLQQPLFAPVARSTGQPGQPGLPGMDPARASLPLPAFASGSMETPGAGLFRAAQMPMQPAANPMTLHLYQALMAASMMGVGGQHPLQEGAPVRAMPSAMNPAINPSMLLGAGLAPPPQPDGGSAAIAQLMAMRSEVLTMHLSVKLFHCTPQELPEDAQEQLTAWLRAAPACTELYIRSGCIHLTLTAYVDEATYAAAVEGGVLAAAKSLVQQRSEIWRRGAMLVQLLGESVMVSNGVPEVPRALAGMCSGAAAKAEPLVGMPGQLIALEVRKLPGDSQPCRVLCRSRGSTWAIQADPLESGDSSSLYAVRLPEDTPPGIAYLEVEQGPFVGRACPVVVVPHERFMAAAEVLQLLRGDVFAACSHIPGVGASAAAAEIATGACTQLGLLLLRSATRTPSRSALAVPEGTPAALQSEPLTLPPSAMAKLTANLLHFAMLWSMPNLASLLLEGLQAQQLPLLQQLQQQQQQLFYQQQPFLFPQAGLAAWGPSWGQPGPAQQQPFQAPPSPHASPLALLAAAAQIADCTVNA